MSKLKLTDANYYSAEANWAYMSASQFKAFRKCEAQAMAELKGEWVRENTMPLLLGSYVDAHFSGEMEQFVKEHPEIFTRTGTKRAEFVKADKAIERLESDRLSKLLLSGKHQTIKTGKIGGVWFKAKMDSLLSPKQVEQICREFPEVRRLVPFGGAMIVDLKYMKDFADVWSADVGEKVSFVEYWGYDYQGGIYQALDKRQAPFVIVGATKEDEPDITAIYIPDDDLSLALGEVEQYAPRYAAMKRGEIEAVGCGRCEYCRSKKKLSGISHYKMTGVVTE